MGDLPYFYHKFMYQTIQIRLYIYRQMISGRELEENHIYPDYDTIFTVAELRIKTGLANGATVVFDASNIERDVRRHYVDLAKAEHVLEIKLYVANAEISNSNIPEPYLEGLKERFEENYPSYEEGWNHIEEIHSRVRDRKLNMNEISF